MAPTRDEASLRHARCYVEVAARADQHYRLGGDGVPAGLALFDQDRMQIEAGWAWACTQATSRGALLIAYAENTAYIGHLRYHPRTERVPQLEAALAAARQLQDLAAQANFLGNLGNA